jgi:prepilin-type N-terminal cleavage/methylation domain-containing protein
MSHPRQGGLSLIEVLVAMVLSSAVSAVAYSFYRNMVGNLERQKRVTSLQDGIRTAVDCINRYLIAGGVSGDSLFFDPHRLLSLPVVNGGHRVFDMSPDSSELRVYGNYSGGAGTVAEPVVEKDDRQVKVDRASLFTVGGYAYFFAGSAQEVARITAIRDSTITVANDFFTYYPKGTLVYPLERIRIAKDPRTAVLQVMRETASGGAIFPRDFMPTARPGDSLEFNVRSMDQETGLISYALTFAATAPDRSRMRLVRRSEQTVSVRGF